VVVTAFIESLPMNYLFFYGIGDFRYAPIHQTGNIANFEFVYFVLAILLRRIQNADTPHHKHR
jgi:hypothetical protein